jgi:predicted signal transduction protein with EAL and GGDEF domain
LRSGREGGVEQAGMRSARVAALYAAAMPTYYGSIAVGAFLVLALWSAYPSEILVGWFAALVAVMLMRAAVHWKYAHGPVAEHDAGRWETRYALSTLAAGAVWTYVPVALFPETDALLQSAVVIVVGGVIISGAALCSASQRAVYALIALPLAALIARLLLHPDRIHKLLALAILLFGFVIVRMSSEIRRSIVEAFGARLHNEQLLERVTESEEKLRIAAEEARFLAYHDALTGLPNRRLLDDRLRQAVFQAQRHDARLAVMLIDLDDF